MHYHVLTQSDDKKTANLVFHIDVPPAADNEVGILYSTCLVEQLIYNNPEWTQAADIQSIVPSITQGELDDIRVGLIYEVAHTIRWGSIDPELTPAEKQAVIEAEYNTKKVELFDKKKVELAYWGKEGDVV